MNSHRDGKPVIVCDGCYRPKEHGNDGRVEEGWERVEGAIDAASIMQSEQKKGSARVTHRTEVPAQPKDYCPKCLDIRKAAAGVR